MTATTLLLLTGALAVLAVGVYLSARLRQFREEPFFHFRCPGCRRRLRYRARQAGHRGGCSNCGQAVTFPPAAEDLA
jgi:hypothetical protein